MYFVTYIHSTGSFSCTLCDPGYKCRAGSVTSSPLGDACQIGGYCNPPTVYTPCPPGTCVCLYVHVPVHVSVYTCICMCVCMFVFLYVRVSVRTCVCTYMCTYLRTCILFVFVLRVWKYKCYVLSYSCTAPLGVTPVLEHE